MNFDFVDVIATLSCAVKKDDQGPLFFRVLLISFREGEKIIQLDGVGLFFLKKDKQGSTRMLNALKIRVALSVLLILVLVLSYVFGWIAPRSVAG